MRFRRRYKRQIRFFLTIALFAFILVKCNIFGVISGIFQYYTYQITEGLLTRHFEGYIGKNELKGIDEILIENINNQMYAANYLYKEGRKQSLVLDTPKYLIKEPETEVKEEVKEENPKEDEAVEVFAPTIPDDSITYSMEQLSDFNFLMSNMYIVPDRAMVLESDLVAEEMLNKDMRIKGSNDTPQILVYHTHSMEAFADSVSGEGMTIIQVGDYLTELLTEYGFNVIHCTESFDVDENGNLDRSNAYVNALPKIQQILADNPTIEVVLDIHRDGLPEGVDKLVTKINGKDTAQIMFFNGLSRSSVAGEIDYLYNQYRSENIALSFQAKLKAMEYYPDFTRKNYLDAYQYNLHVKDKAMLIEVGAQNNTFNEARNAMEPLADILYMIFSGKG